MFAATSAPSAFPSWRVSGRTGKHLHARTHARTHVQMYASTRTCSRVAKGREKSGMKGLHARRSSALPPTPAQNHAYQQSGVAKAKMVRWHFKEWAEEADAWSSKEGES